MGLTSLLASHLSQEAVLGSPCGHEKLDFDSKSHTPSTLSPFPSPSPSHGHVSVATSLFLSPPTAWEFQLLLLSAHTGPHPSTSLRSHQLPSFVISMPSLTSSVSSRVARKVELFWTLYVAA